MNGTNKPAASQTKAVVMGICVAVILAAMVVLQAQNIKADSSFQPATVNGSSSVMWQSSNR